MSSFGRNNVTDIIGNYCVTRTIDKLAILLLEYNKLYSCFHEAVKLTKNNLTTFLVNIFRIKYLVR